jgi:hypothetical protein
MGPDALLRFGDLRIIVNLEGGLEWVYAPVLPTNVACINPNADSLRD